MAKYDVFLSYHRADEAAVRQVAGYLATNVGLEVFFDQWNLIPGEPWQEAIEEALAEAASCAVFIGTRGIGPWEHEEMRVAIDRRVGDRDFRVIPVLLPGARRGDRGRLPSFLTRATWVEFRQELEEQRVLTRLVAGIRGRSPGPDPVQLKTGDIHPYRGLGAFEEEHARFFFGREASTDWLMSLLGESRFLAVIGPSGSGKSSLVRAGLVPALRGGEPHGHGGRQILVLKPGQRPLESLAFSLASLGGQEVSAADLGAQISAMREDSRQVHLMVGLALRQEPEDHQAVLVVDQFEEVFTLCADEDEREVVRQLDRGWADRRDSDLTS